MIQNKMGRPSKYKPEYAEMLTDYFESAADRPYKKELVKRIVKYYENGAIKQKDEQFQFTANKLPTLFNFAQSIGVDCRTLLRWSIERVGPKPQNGEKDCRPYRYLDFCRAYKQVKLFQTEFLTAIGLGGMAPSAFAIFTAKNVIGWRDGNDVRFTDEKGNDATPAGYVLLPKRLEEADKITS